MNNVLAKTKAAWSSLTNCCDPGEPYENRPVNSDGAVGEFVLRRRQEELIEQLYYPVAPGRRLPPFSPPPVVPPLVMNTLPTQMSLPGEPQPEIVERIEEEGREQTDTNTTGTTGGTRRSRHHRLANIYVRDVDEVLVQMGMDESIPIVRLKKKIGKLFLKESESIRLFIRDQEMEDGWTAADYHIQPFDTIQIRLRDL